MIQSAAREKIRAFIVENFLYTRPDFVFSDDDSLLRKGVFDSLGVMEVIGFIESTWGFQVSPDEIVDENFGTLNGIANYVTRKLSSTVPDDS